MCIFFDTVILITLCGCGAAVPVTKHPCDDLAQQNLIISNTEAPGEEVMVSHFLLFLKHQQNYSVVYLTEKGATSCCVALYEGRGKEGEGRGIVCFERVNRRKINNSLNTPAEPAIIIRNGKREKEPSGNKCNY